jgi:hypothetical protein
MIRRLYLIHLQIWIIFINYLIYSMKTISAVVVWFAVITTIAILFASCGTSGHACDAYGQVDTEERI